MSLVRRLTVAIGAVLMLVLAGLPATATAPAQPPDRPVRPAERTGIDPVALQAGLQELADAGGVGIVARVTAGQQGWAGSLGSAAPGTPATPDARFRAASVTKMLTSVLALQLVDRGQWTLDTTIGDVLPGLWPTRSRVTLRQLLSHTSGMPDHLSALIAGAKTPRQFQRVISQRRTDHELVRAAKRQPWEFPPGTSFGYSNTNFVTVGLMLERAVGTPVSRLMERRIFRPAGMTQSALTRSPRIRPPELVETGVLGKKLRDLSGTEPSLFSYAGALVTTTADLDKFQAALSSGLLVSRARLHAMRANVAVQPNGLSYGLGSYRLPDPCDKGRYVFGHDGATFGTLTMTFARPKGHMRVTVSMSGRDLDDVKAKQELAMGTYVLDAFAQTCRDVTRLPVALPRFPG